MATGQVFSGHCRKCRMPSGCSIFASSGWHLLSIWGTRVRDSTIYRNDFLVHPTPAVSVSLLGQHPFELIIAEFLSCESSITRPALWMSSQLWLEPAIRLEKSWEGAHRWYLALQKAAPEILRGAQRRKNDSSQTLGRQAMGRCLD